MLIALLLALTFIYSLSTVNAFAANNSKDAVLITVKDRLNNEVCTLNDSDTDCDLSSATREYKKPSSGSLEFNAKLNILTLKSVDAPDLTVSLDGQISIAAEGVATVGRIEQLETTATLTFTNGQFNANYDHGAGIESAGRLNVQKNANINAIGTTYGVYAAGNLILDANSTLIGTTTANEGVGVLADGISVAEAAILEGHYRANDASGDDSDVDTSIPNNATGIASGWQNSFVVNAKDDAPAKIATFGTSYGITTKYPIDDPNLTPGDITLNGAQVNIGQDNVNPQSNLDSAQIDPKKLASGISGGSIKVHNSTLHVSATLGMASASDLTIDGTSDVEVKSTSIGITAKDIITVDFLEQGHLHVTADLPKFDDKIFGGSLICGSIIFQDTPSACKIDITDKSALLSGSVNDIDQEMYAAFAGVTQDGVLMTDLRINAVPVPWYVLIWRTFGVWLIVAIILALALIVGLLYKLMRKKPALLVINMQNDVVDKNTFKVPNQKSEITPTVQFEPKSNLQLVDLIAEYIKKYARKYKRVYFVKEAHSDLNSHVIEAHFGTWCKHAVDNTDGAEFTPKILDFVKSLKNGVVAVTGSNDDGYDAFAGIIFDDNENRVINKSHAKDNESNDTETTPKNSLEASIKYNKIKRINIVGLPLDYAILKTALTGAEKLGKNKVSVLSNLILSATDSKRILTKLREKGVKVV